VFQVLFLIFAEAKDVVEVNAYERKVSEKKDDKGLKIRRGFG
jgi:hypothetical protein